MLIEFTVGNYLSIKDRQTLRLDASSISEYKDQLINAGRYQLLRSAVIYGANASGKSNVLKAMATMGYIVITSAERSSTAEIEVEPFLLNTETEKAPSYFEIVFVLNGNRYRYGFEADRKVIQAEWLYAAKKEQEKPLFLREKDGIEVFASFKEGKGLEEKTRNNALFLAVCDQFNGQIAEQIFEWFNKLLPVSGIGHDRFRSALLRLIEAPPIQERLMNVVTQLNLGFSDVHLQKEKIDDAALLAMPTETRRIYLDLLQGQRTVDIMTVHKKYDSNNRFVDNVIFDLQTRESSGTNKFFDLLAPIYLAILDRGILVIDELDAKLHPLMTQAIIRTFNDPELNPNNAQLIFATHDTNLLTYGGFRRDQIYFTEKDQYGATCMYSLVEYQEENGDKVRKDRSFEKDYIQGRYGAIPFIGDLSKLVPAWHEK